MEITSFNDIILPVALSLGVLSVGGYGVTQVMKHAHPKFRNATGWWKLSLAFTPLLVAWVFAVASLNELLNFMYWVTSTSTTEIKFSFATKTLFGIVSGSFSTQVYNLVKHRIKRGENNAPESD